MIQVQFTEEPKMLNAKEDEMLSKKNLYECYWKCRDFEIKNLWQRAVFLGPFLILCITGYGSFFLKAFVGKNKCCLQNLDAVYLHLIAFFISFFGMCFSVLWIKMMKGSKAWYEVYERSIIATDTQKNWIFDKELLECGSGFKQYRLPGYKIINSKPSFDDNLFSQEGGCYSPSKINIAIGQVSLVFWIIISFAHLLACIFIFSETPMFFALIIFFVEFLAVIHVVYEVFKSRKNCKERECFFECRSEALKDRDPGVLDDKMFIVRIVDTDDILKNIINFPLPFKSWTLYDAFEKTLDYSLKIVVDIDFEQYAKCPCYASFNFKTWCDRNGLEPSNQSAQEFLKKEIEPIFKHFRDEVKSRI